jgi:DNA modification methylase
MYFDMWRNDAYLQFMYERLQLLRELLSETGSIFIHLDWHIGHYIKLVLDEIFGQENFKNEIIWHYDIGARSKRQFGTKHDNIFWYSKSNNWKYNAEEVLEPFKSKMTEWRYTKGLQKGKPMPKGKIPSDVWDITLNAMSSEHLGFNTQKPEALLERIIKASTDHDDLVLDCFIGSGTTARVAQKLGRRWIGCDINKGAIQLTARELQKIILDQIKNKTTKYQSFAIYKVNNYDLQLLQTEAVELAVQHIGIQRIKTDPFFDGTLGNKLVKIIDFNHPFTLLDLQLIQDELKKRPNEDRDIIIICLDKELAVDPEIEEWNKKHPVNKIEVIELKTDKKYGNFLIHKPDEAKVKIKRRGNKAIIEIQDFISPTIIERLNIDNQLFKVKIPDFRAMIDYVLIDTNYDGKTFHIIYSDVPEKKSDLIKGKYELEIPNGKTKIALKIVDMLGEEVLLTKEV